MANEKIKCKSCRKSFDPDLYSGLCPKCGTYNGQRMNSSALEHYISGGDQGESQHRELHEKYDKSYQAAHPDHNEKAVLLQEAREAFAKRQNARQETLINGRPVRKSALPKFFITLVITVIIAIAVIVISVIYNNIVLIGKTEAHEVQLLPETNPGTVIFDHELLDGPIIVTALSAGMVEDIEGLSGKSIYAVTVSGGSEEYNFDA